MTARVTIFRTDLPARQVVLERANTYLIGRSPECNIRIDDPELSRRHARLSADGEHGWRIEDLQSKNGVLVGGLSIANAQLGADTWIGLGSLACRFERLSEAQRRRAAQRSSVARDMTLAGKRRIDAAGDVRQVLQHLLASVLSVSSTDRGFALLTQPDGDMEVACWDGVDRNEFGRADFAGSRGAIREALDTGRSVVTCDARVHEALARRQSIVTSRIRSLVCLPLTVFDRIVGLIYADSVRPGKFFTDLDIQLLEELAEHAGIVVAAAQLGDQLDGVDRALVDSTATSVRVKALKHRIPSVNKNIPGAQAVPMTGVLWSQIETPA